MHEFVTKTGFGRAKTNAYIAGGVSDNDAEIFDRGSCLPTNNKFKKKQGIYEKYIKRILDIVCASLALIVFSWLYIILIIIGAIAMKGNPFFTQERPGKIDSKTGKEKIFKLIKFRTMTNEKDKNGNLLPDEKRLNRYGCSLRTLSLDEIPSLINIIKGDIAVVGPRPQLVKDMIFMTAEQRNRHTVHPGLTGLAQCNGRNNMSWEKKFEYDLDYISHITFWGDAKIIFKTVFAVLKRDGINEEGQATAEDLGEYLLKNGKITLDEYENNQVAAGELLRTAKI